MFCVYNVRFTSNILIYAQITMLVSSFLQASIMALLLLLLILLIITSFNIINNVIMLLCYYYCYRCCVN